MKGTTLVDKIKIIKAIQRFNNHKKILFKFKILIGIDLLKEQSRTKVWCSNL